MGRDTSTNHRVRSLLIAGLAAALFWSAFLLLDSSRSQAESRAAVALTREARLAIFDDVWSTINQRYYDRNFQGLDWDAQRITYRDLAAGADSSHELYSVLRRMIASLNDSHTRIFAPGEKFDWWRPRFVTIGISVREIDGLPTVVQVERNSAPHREGIHVGDVIESVDGQSALSLINKRLGSPRAATGPSRTRAFAALIEGLPETNVQVSWKTRDDKIKTGQFRRYWRQRELGIRVRRKGSFAVVEMDAFTKPIAATFARAVRENLPNARGIILDFRDNGGGDAEAMTDVASAFLGSGSSLGQFTDRFGSSYAISTRSKSPFIARGIERTQLPVIVLTSERTSSAAEIFIAALTAAGRARIVGVETCGCVLAIRHRHTLPDGGILDVSEMDYQTAFGQRLEKQGIKPDYAVTAQRMDLYAERDRAMATAISELKKRRAQLY
jgi:C-terminal peptidase prc